jgi:membrane associated rhomboid family serine protease
MISLFFIGNFVEKLIGRKRFLIFYILSGIFAGLFYVFLSYFFGNASLIIGTSAFNIGEKLFLNPEVYAVGASGAIFALIGVLAVLTPYNKVYLLLGPLMAIILQAVFSSVFPESAFSSVLNIFVTIYFLVSIFSIISFNPLLRKIAIPVAMQFWILPIISIVPLMIIGLFVELPIGNTAHLGGLITGIFYAVFLRKKYKRKTEMIRNYFR